LSRFRPWPISTHLITLIALLAIPSISLIVYSGITERHEAIASARAEALKFVNDVAGQQQAIVAGAEQLETALSLLPAIQTRDAAAASRLFGKLVKENPQYANILACDKAGLVWASALALEGKFTATDRRYFQEPIRTGMFSFDEYTVGRIAKKPIIGFGYPVKNAANKLTAVIAITLDLEYSQHIFERLNLPPGSSHSLLDHRGTILFRSLIDPFSEKLVGGRDTSQELFTKMTKGPDEGTYEAMGNDGRFRLIAYKRLNLAHESTPYLYIRSSIPFASAVSKANAAMFRNLSIFVSLFLIGLFLAWVIGKRVIMNPLMMLKEAAGRLAGGADAVHVSSVVKGGELGEVARAFDGMAEALIQEKTALRKSQQRWSTTLASIGDAVIATDIEGRITFMNAVAEGLTGWTLKEAAAKPVADVFNIINEQTRGQVENPVTRVLREGMIVGLANHTVLMKKDGSEVPIDDSGAPIRDENGNTTGVVLIFRDITERKKAEERARHLASFPELNPAPILEVNASGEITFCNPGALTILKDAGMDGADCERLLPEDLGHILRNWDKEIESTIYREIALKNKVFAETIHLMPQFNVARVYAFDITERKRVEEELRESRAKLQAALASMTDAVFISDTEGRFIEFNDAFATYYKFRNKEECLKTLVEYPDIIDVFLPDGTLASLGMWAVPRALRGETATNAEYTLRRKDTGETWVGSYSFAPIRDKEGVIVGSVVVGRDITGQKEMQEELRKSRDELERRVQERTEALRRQADLLELAHSAIIVRDLESKILFWNHGAEERYGWTKAEALGKVTHSLLETQFPVSFDAYMGILIKEGRWRGELLHTTKDGRQITVASRQALQKDTLGNPIAILEINLDVTEARRTEQQLRQAQKMEALGTLAGGIAHDFNNILAAIIGFTELLKDHVPEGSREAHHLKRVMESSLRGRDLVKQMLTYSRKAEQEKKPLSLSSIVKETVRLIRATTPTTISIKVNTGSESGMIFADPTQTQQVIMNLCTNAAHAMREKGGTLDIRLDNHNVSPSDGSARGINPGLYTRLAVSDTGTGMPPDILDKIFDPFFTTKKLGEGTGLGLSVVLGIVKQSNGHITVYSELGGGSTFAVYFPQITGAGEQQADAVRDDEVPTGTERILFVDDEETLVEMGEDILAELGYDVTSRISSREALALFRLDPSRFDLVITDQTMPEMTGLELTKEILALKPDMPIIMCTGFSYLVDADKAKAAGIKAFAMKPLTKREIAKTIRKVLGR